MFRYVVLFFIVVPLLELYVLIKVGGIIGPALTVALVILTAMVGTFLLRQQGLSTMRRVQGNLARGVLPATELVEGLVVLVSGAFLLAPGFVTDALGLLGLIPAVRRRLAEFVLSRLQGRVVGFADGRTAESRKQHTIEGEYRRDR